MNQFVISAAGLGSRLGMNIPKCLLQVHEGRLIDYLLALLPVGADIRIVVGFREADVIAHVTRNWPDVSFVRNANFATTSNSHSLHLATRFSRKPFVAIDGDLLIDSISFHRFLAFCEKASTSVVGVTHRTTEEAIGVRLADGMVTAFIRPGAPGYDGCAHEWCGIAYFNGASVVSNKGYVFEELAKNLPLPACEIKCWEIDTPKDLERALHAFTAASPPPLHRGSRFLT